jgi:hypothetical protein
VLRLDNSFKNRALIPAWHRWVEHIGELARNRAILKRWTNRPLARIFLRWVEHFVESKRLTAVARKVILRAMKQNVARAFYKWSSNVFEDVRLKKAFTKVLLRWTSMTIWSAFSAWHENTWSKDRARSIFQHFAQELLHTEQEKSTYETFANTISLQIERMTKSESLNSCPAVCTRSREFCHMKRRSVATTSISRVLMHATAHAHPRTIAGCATSYGKTRFLSQDCDSKYIDLDLL